MKKRLLSLLLVLAVVFSFSLSAFATDTGIDIIDDPLSYYFENQMLGVQKGTGVTLVCPKCDYKVVYTGGTLVTCPYDGEALVLADLAGVHAEKVPSGIGRKDLPGYIDNSGTAHVSKEGKLKFVAHPCWLDVGEQESNKFTLTDPYKPYRVQEEDEDYGLYVYDWLGYNNGISHFSLYTQPLSDDILILSNVDLCVPYERLTGLAQVCAISKANEIYDDEHDTLTITIVCMDELSVQMNSRSFKDNINAYFLNTLMCCRHYHISFYGSAQRFQHVDKMLRDVTMNVVQCKKVWRFQFNSYYDGFQLENAQDPTLVRPLRRACWFVTDADYNAYDTLQVVDNLQKSFNENDMLTEAEILANQAAPAPVGMDAVTPSRKAKKIMREKVNR